MADQGAANQPLPEDRAARDSVKRSLARFMRGHENCDGVNQKDLRCWLKRAALAPEFIPELSVRDAREVWASQTTGVLVQALRTYIPAHPSIDGLLQYVTAQCVSTQEDWMVVEVDQYRQSVGQSVLEYISEFRLRVNHTYTAQDLTSRKVARHLLTTFVNGLVDERVRFGTADAKPRDLDQALTAALEAETRNAWVRQDVRIEEPMEIGAVTPPPAAMTTATALLTTIEKLTERLDALEKGRREVKCCYCKKTEHDKHTAQAAHTRAQSKN